MALNVIDGFDLWTAGTPPTPVPAVVSPAGSLVPTLSSSIVAFADTHSQSIVYTPATSNTPGWVAQGFAGGIGFNACIVGFWFRWSGTMPTGSFPSSTNPIVGFVGADSGGSAITGYQFELGVDASGILRVTQNAGSATFCSGTHSLVANQWYFIEIQASLSTSISANSFFVKLNGTTECTVPTATNTTVLSGTQIHEMRLGWLGTASQSAFSIFLDDLYVFDLTGASKNTPFGPEHVHSTLPSTLALVRLASASASDSATFTGATFNIGNKRASASDSATFSVFASVPFQGGRTDILGIENSFPGNLVPGFGGRMQPVGMASDSIRVMSAATARKIGTRSASASDSAKFTGLASSAGGIVVTASASEAGTFSEHLNAFNTIGAPGNAWFRTASDSAIFAGGLITTSKHGHASDSGRFSDHVITGNSKAGSASSLATFSDFVHASVPRVITQHVRDSFFFLSTLASVHNTAVKALASDSAAFTDAASGDGLIHIQASASDSASFTDRAFAAPLWKPQSIDQATFASFATETRVTDSAASDSATFTGLASSARAVSSSASDSATFTGVAKSNQFLDASASDSATFTGLASDTVLKFGGYDSAHFTDRVDVSILLPSGSVVPGGDQQLGLRSVLLGSLSSEFPFSYAQSPDGLVLLANGVDPILAWDGLSGAAWGAGLSAPDTVTDIGGDGTGAIVGRRWAYVRWVDNHNNVSNLGPVSDSFECGTDGLISGVTHAANGVATVKSVDHGLHSGAGVIISGVGGLPIVNGTFTVVVIDADRFALSGVVVTSGDYTSGGSWTAGKSTINYTFVPIPTDTKVARRQILRNLQGDASVFYVDIDTADLTSTSFSSSKTDEQLATGQAVPLRFVDKENASNRFFQGGFPASQRHGTPPSWKRSLASYAGRIFAGGDLVYSAGNVQVSLGSQIVLGLGTSWTAAFMGRLLYVEGAPNSFVIESVDTANQILTLELPYSGPSQTFGFYSLRPAPVERQLVYYSEANLPESWPTWNAFAVPETEDEIVGLMVQKSFLFILKERNLFKFSYKNDPGRDGYMFPIGRRGCVNARSWIDSGGKSYLLDEMGVYSFDGDAIEHVSGAVSSLFKPDGNSQYRVDWSTDRTLWHASLDPQRETIRWFVDLVGFPSLTYAVCYNFRREQWWLENFAERMTASTVAVVNGRQQAIAGTTGRRVAAFGHGTLDLIQESVTGTLRGSVTSPALTTLQDDNAIFPANLAGVTVSLVTGKGAGQQAIISSSTSTVLSLLDPWNVTPAAGDEYQIGGVNWTWKSGWRRIVDDEAENIRDLEVVFAPTPHPGSFSLSMYHDHSKQPFDGWAYSQERDGVSIVEDSPNVIVSTATPRGYATQRLSGHRDPYGYGHRYLSIQLTGSQGVDPTRVYQLSISGVE